MLAEGVFRMAPDGTLVREQRRPTVERTEIWEHFVAVTEGDDDEPNLYPIPASLVPMLEALRALVSGSAETLRAQYDLALREDPQGWRLEMDPVAGDRGRLTVMGCGTVVDALELTMPDGAVRFIRFGPSD